MITKEFMMIKYIPLFLLLALVRSDSTDVCELTPKGIWSQLLEDWATSAPTQTGRQARIMVLPNTKGYYVTDRIDLVPPPPPRNYDEWHQMTPPPAPNGGKIVNRPQNPYKDKFKPSYPPPQPPKPIPAQTQGPNSIDRLDNPPQRKEVSETDLYLLGAIEKLVYRVDLMEKRLRKMEESVHHLVIGGDKTPAPDPCIRNFSRIGGACYHLSSEAVDWKTANLACRKMKGNLVEMDSESKRRTITSGLQTDKKNNGMDWWTGGLNPGLLWIWSNSGKPVLNNATDNIIIHGEGRCLLLAYDPAIKSYTYKGIDCSFRHRYICQKEDDKTALSNEIERVAKELKFVGKGLRQGRSEIDIQE